MAVLGLKSVPLWRATNEAWKTVKGFYFIDRKRGPESTIQHIKDRKYEAIINLGRVDIDVTGVRQPFFNPPEVIRAISTPRALGRLLPDYIPPPSVDMPHWHKERGYGGRGKRFCRECGAEAVPGQIQTHVEGQEYRILTVGEKIVQASRKVANNRIGGVNDFTYEWVGVDAIRNGGFVPHIKEAILDVPSYERTVLGWDVIHDGDRPWTIEINTSPGVNAATADRIVRAVRGRQYG